MRKVFLKTVFAAAALAAVLAVGGCGGSAATETASEVTEASSEAGETAESKDAAEGTAEDSKDGQAAGEDAGQTADSKMEATDAEYLKTWFGVELSEESLDGASFSEALQSVAGEEAPAVEGELTWESAVQAAVKAADYEELALSYPEEKTGERLKQYGVELKTETAETETAEETAETETAEETAGSLYPSGLAAALDVSLITAEDAGKAAAGEAFTAADAEKLLMNIAEANGDARNYLGMASDPDIYGKVDQAWNSFLLFDDSRLSEVGKEAVLQQISTGYGIKSAAYDARFLPNLTLQYGHSDIKHAHQLLGLLNSEDLDAKVQLEPKISIYQYLLEWGPVPEATPTYEVKQFDNLYLVYAVEYDMQLEFNNTEDMLRFDSVIKEYAKKNEGNEEAEGLIYGSWWQPLYSTTRTDMPAEDYHQMYDCVVKNGIYSIHPFALPENKDTVVEKLKELAGDLEVETVERYCNSAFFNYLSGEDYQ